MRRFGYLWVGGCLGLGLASAAWIGCGDDDGNEADDVGVASECAIDDDCPDGTRGDEDFALSCLIAFKSGYCGVAGCAADGGCPDGSACVNHDDGNAYCFRLCAEKSDCNRHRSADAEANCSASIDFVSATRAGKACVPPSSGD